MNALFNNIRKIITEVERERGPFQFAALVDRLDNPLPGKYDLLVSAPWIDRDKPFYEYFLPKLTKEDWNKLLRVIVLNPSGEFLQDFLQIVGPMDQEQDVMSKRIADIDIKYAHLFAIHPVNSSYSSTKVN